MSGLFKSFDRLISASTFASNQHKYLVKFCLSRFCPASFYFDPNVLTNGLSKDHNLDAFALSLNAAQLSRLNANYQAILQDIATKDANDSSVKRVQAEVQENVTLNQKAIKLYFDQLLLQLRSGAFTFPVQSCADIIFTLSQQQNPNAHEIISNLVVPTLLQKLQYASTNNLIDIVTGLYKLNYLENTELWKKIFQTIKNKQFAWEFVDCQYHGWALSVYEKADGQSQSWSLCNQSELEAFWNDVKGGNYQIAQLKRLIRFYLNFGYNRIVLPFFFRENRVQYNFPQRNLYGDKEEFIQTLKKLQEKFSEVESIFEAFKARQANN